MDSTVSGRGGGGKAGSFSFRPQAGRAPERAPTLLSMLRKPSLASSDLRRGPQNTQSHQDFLECQVSSSRRPVQKVSPRSLRC